MDAGLGRRRRDRSDASPEVDEDDGAARDETRTAPAPHCLGGSRLHLGHQDGGRLVRELYGHPDAAIARERTREAFRSVAAVAALPVAVPVTDRSLQGVGR